jgi:hypothetical protein
MDGKSVILDSNTPIYVTLSTDAQGKTTIGIRVDGGDQCPIAYGVILPAPGCAQTWSKNIGEIM